MSTNDRFLMLVSVAVGSILAVLIAYCLLRGLRSGVMIAASTKSARVTKFYRKERPGEYWLMFVFWLLLIPIIIWLVIGRVHELRHRHIPNHRAGVDAGIPFLSASEHQRLGTTHRGCYARPGVPKP